MDNNKNCLNCKYNVNKENKNYCLIGSGFYNGTDEMCAETSCEKWEDAGMTGTMSLTMAIKALEQQPSEDCISRQAVIDYAKDTCLDLYKYEDTEMFCDEIKAMPPVTPQRPKGKWIKVLEHMDEFGSAWHYECSECRARSYKGYKPLERYCPKCGAEMNGGGEK